MKRRYSILHPPERLVAYFRGSVQGVGFRYTTVWEAKDFALSGYVKNLRDGRVELIAEGQRAELEKFVRRVKERFSRYIKDAEVTFEHATGEFDGFDIRY